MKIRVLFVAAVVLLSSASRATVMCQTCEPIEDTWNCTFTAEQHPSSTQCTVLSIQRWDRPEEYHWTCILGAHCALNGGSRFAGKKSQCLVAA